MAARLAARRDWAATARLSASSEQAIQIWKETWKGREGWGERGDGVEEGGR